MVHGTIAEAAGNPMVTSSIRDLRRRTHIFNTARIPHRLLPGASEHIALLHAVSGNDPELSRQMMGQHLDNVKNAIIECILGVRGPYQSAPATGADPPWLHRPKVRRP